MLGEGQGAELALRRRRGARGPREVKGEGRGQGGRGGQGEGGRGKGERESMGKEKGDEERGQVERRGESQGPGSSKEARTSHPGTQSMASNGIEGRKIKRKRYLISFCCA